MKNLSKYVLAAAAGVAIGGVLGILFAPDKGEKTREDISEKSKKFLREINEQMSAEILAELKKKFEEQLEKIDERIKRSVNVD